MGLFKKKRTNSVGENIDRLTPEGELPFGWMTYNKEIIKQMDDQWLVFRTAIDDAKDPVKKYAAMKSYIIFLADGRKHYTKINACAGKYFDEYYCDTPYSNNIFKQFRELEKKLKKE